MAGWDEVIFVPDDDQIAVSRNTAPINVVAVVNASLASGVPGDDGDTGDYGPPGPQGGQGPQGVQGPVGIPGDDADDGFPLPGPQGATGSSGPPGQGFLASDDGDDGWTVPGPLGNQGVQGIQGAVGVTGEDGDDGWTVPGPVGTLSNASPISIGFNLSPYNAGTFSSGTFTPNALNANYQYCTNGGAFTLANPTNDCAIDILVTNNASAGAITFTGFTVGANTGDALDTVNGHLFIVSIRRINATSTYMVKALQ